METPVNEWKFDPSEILKSKRKVTGTFHKPVIDKDGEYITSDAIRKSVPDYMHLPALHDFHKERPVGLATRVWEQSDGSFGFEGVIKATEDCNDIWEKIQKGNYDHVSIFGKRTVGNQNCSLPQGLRTGPCVTDGVRLDSISVCDDNARNDSTSLAVKKAQLIFDAEVLMKADWERDKDGNFRSTPYKLNPDGSPAGKTKGKLYSDKGDEIEEEDVEKGYSKTSHTLGLGKDERNKKTASHHEINWNKRPPMQLVNTTPSADRARRRELNKSETEEKKALPSENAGKKGYRESIPGSMGLIPIDKRRQKKEGNYWEKKAETAEDSNLMHTPTDYADERKCPCPKTKYKVVEKGVKSHPGHVVSGQSKETNSQSRYLQEGKDAVSSGGKRGELNPTYKRVKKGENMDDDVEKGVGHRDINEGLQTAKRSGRPRTAQKPEDAERVIRRNKRDMKKGEEDDEMTDEEAPKEVEKGQWGDQQIGELRTADRHKTHKPKPKSEKTREQTSGVKYDKMEKADDENPEGWKNNPSDEVEGNKERVRKLPSVHTWAEKKVQKSEKEHEVDTMTRGTEEKRKQRLKDDEDEEEDQEEEMEEKETPGEVEKSVLDEMDKKTNPHDHKTPQQSAATTARRRQGNTQYNLEHGESPERHDNQYMRNMGARGLKHLSKKFVRKGEVQKGDTMEEDEEVSQEYVTKAMVPIEEVDTIIKARTEEISKAYTAQFDEIKKSYDGKISELTNRLDKMAEETIRKGGSVIVIPELLDSASTGSMSNADALARMTAGR